MRILLTGGSALPLKLSPGLFCFLYFSSAAQRFLRSNTRLNDSERRVELTFMARRDEFRCNREWSRNHEAPERRRIVRRIPSLAPSLYLTIQPPTPPPARSEQRSVSFGTLTCRFEAPENCGGVSAAKLSWRVARRGIEPLTNNRTEVCSAPPPPT